MVLEFLNDQLTTIMGFIITFSAVAGIFYKGVMWLRNEVKKENDKMKTEVNTTNQQIKNEALERIEQNRQDIQGVASNITKELKSNNELTGMKLDSIAKAASENKTQIENYAKDIGRTVARNNDKVNDHETRISIVETKIWGDGVNKKDDSSYMNRNRRYNEKNNDHNDYETGLGDRH